MSTWTDKYASGLKLQVDAIIGQVRNTQPDLAAAFEKRIREELVAPAGAILDKLDAIRTSGRYTQEGDRAERRLLLHGFLTEKLSAVEQATVTKLAQQREAQRAALHKPKREADPALALVTELRAQEWRRKLEALPPLELQVLLRQTDSMDLLDVLEGAPAGFPIVPPEQIAEARTRIAEANHPELGQLAALEGAYSFCIGVARKTVLEASGLTELEAAAPPVKPAKDDRVPYLVSSGEAVPK